ncbi:Sulfoacetaldehyde reductase [Vibrio ruber DSM 16370]|uniref:Sulfoacetaldehyde reductase n=1 Tax=Vibrio ruber (strain DSM 16370 / JCM 11486 / BCRC 17186 / CECT 7878 / LMG 23124 / VR1) TaxID=1123498 RepID=A0A1R4LKC4_VIBR1|nr:SDR family oxidoreductase [Vibrio ruber]SJN57051.1 Sulfoacetaldehyde reductase [Vibrio ruber DSM 16370]
MSRVLITGATSGIGKQLAHDYAQQGWQVIACGRNEAALNELRDKHASITPLQFDLTDIDQTLAILSELPFTPTLWILNAGGCEYIDDGVMDAKLMARVMQINVLGLANTIEAIQPHLKSGHRVAIVGSIASELALPRAEAYGASKAAVGYLARSLRLDWARKGIDITCVFPGFVATPLTEKNTFEMPMMISVEHASQSIRKGLEKGVANFYFPARFTWIIRLLGMLPYGWQYRLARRFFAPKRTTS